MEDKKLTAHEKKVELAKAGAPNYGIYIDGGSVEKLSQTVDSLGRMLIDILTCDADEKTKRQALSIFEKAAPGVRNMSISNVSVTQK